MESGSLYQQTPQMESQPNVLAEEEDRLARNVGILYSITSQKVITWTFHIISIFQHFHKTVVMYCYWLRHVCPHGTCRHSLDRLISGNFTKIGPWNYNLVNIGSKTIYTYTYSMKKFRAFYETSTNRWTSITFHWGGGGGGWPLKLYIIYVWFKKLSYKYHVVSTAVTQHYMQLYWNTYKYNYMFCDYQCPNYFFLILLIYFSTFYCTVHQPISVTVWAEGKTT